VVGELKRTYFPTKKNSFEVREEFDVPKNGYVLYRVKAHTKCRDIKKASDWSAPFVVCDPRAPPAPWTFNGNQLVQVFKEYFQFDWRVDSARKGEEFTIEEYHIDARSGDPVNKMTHPAGSNTIKFIDSEEVFQRQGIE